MVALMNSGTLTSAEIANGIGVSWNTISRYNSSKQFLNYNNGSSTNNAMTFRKGDVVFINTNADTYWENQTWDTDVAYSNNGIFNLTNTSGGWNVFGMQNQSGFSMGRIELGILKSNICMGNLSIFNCSYYDVAGLSLSNNITLPLNNSIQSIVFYNNTAISNKKFVPHPFNYSFNNASPTIDYGEVVWININNSINGTNLMVFNTTHMGDA